MPKGRKKKQETKKLNVTVTLLIVLSILLAVLIYTKQVYLGKTLSPWLGGGLGYIKYFVPIGLALIAIYIAYEKDTTYYAKKVVMFFIILILIDIIFSTFQVSKGNLKITE